MHRHINRDFKVINAILFLVRHQTMTATIGICLLPIKTIAKLPLTLMEARLSPNMG